MARFSKANTETVLQTMLALEAEDKETLEATAKALSASTATVGPIRNRILEARRATAEMPESVKLLFGHVWTECSKIASLRADEMNDKLDDANARISELESEIEAANVLIAAMKRSAEKTAFDVKVECDKLKKQIVDLKKSLDGKHENLEESWKIMRERELEIVELKRGLNRAEGALDVYRVLVPSIDPSREYEREENATELAKVKKNAFLASRNSRILAEQELEKTYENARKQDAAKT